MKKVLSIIMILSTLIMISCNQVPQESANVPIKVGVMLSLSGDAASWGESAKKGIELAIEQNISKNRKIEFVFEDTGGDAKRAVLAYKKLTSIDHVFAIIGPLIQTEMNAIIPLILEDKIPVISPSYANRINRPNLYNPLLIWMDPPLEAQLMANYVFESGIRKVAIVSTVDSWENEISKAFSAQFKKLGGIVTGEEYILTQSDYVKSTVTKIVSTKPEAIFVGTAYQFIQSVKAIHDLGFTGALLSAEVDTYLAGETKVESEGLKFIAPDFYTSQFMQDFEKKYGDKPGIPAGQAFDATNLLLNYLKKYSDTNQVLKAMEEFKEYDGVSGKIMMDSDSRMILPTAIFQLHNGEIIKVK